MNQPVAKVNQDFLIKRASDALKLSKKISDMSEVLEGDKAFFREQADGETLKLEVPGVGSLLVKTPVVPAPKQVMTFDEDKFQFLSADIKQALISMGVVQIKTVTSSGAKASVVLSPNK